MRILLKILLFFSAFTFLSAFFYKSYTYAQEATFSGTVKASNDYALPYPGILPDHPLYKIKLLRDEILLYFTRDPLKKANIELLMSDKQLVMGELLSQRGKNNLSSETISQSEKGLLQTISGVSSLKQTSSLPAGFADKLELSARKHKEVITKIMDFAKDDELKNDLSKSLEITNQAIEQTVSLKG